MRLRHYFRKRVQEHAGTYLAEAVCNAPEVLGLLSKEPQPRLSWLSRLVAFVTTPFKFLGISGWKETGCEARLAGRPVRPAQHSTDGFWTIDLSLEAFSLGTVSAPPGRFIRLEMEPSTAAHRICEAEEITPAMRVSAGGAVVVDTDGPFLEVHPDQDFKVER